MPYRIDVLHPSQDALDRLVHLGALDIEELDAGLAAIIPDGVTPDAVAEALGVSRVDISPAVARDDGSVWLLNPRAVLVGSVVIAPPEVAAPPAAIRLTDSPAFGTGHHPTTALCIEALEEALAMAVPESVLDVGTGSGVLALAALALGVPQAVGVDIDADALEVAAENARLNNRVDRLQLHARRTRCRQWSLAARPGERARRAADRDGAGPCSPCGESWPTHSLRHPMVSRIRSEAGV